MTTSRVEDRHCEYEPCGQLIRKKPTRAWADYAKAQFCSQAHAMAHRRAQPCPKCVALGRDGQDWYEAPSGKRACRPCKAGNEKATRGGGERAVMATRPRACPPTVPPAPPAAPRPPWRPDGFTAEPTMPAWCPPLAS